MLRAMCVYDRSVSYLGLHAHSLYQAISADISSPSRVKCSQFLSSSGLLLYEGNQGVTNGTYATISSGNGQVSTLRYCGLIVKYLALMFAQHKHSMKQSDL